MRHFFYHTDSFILGSRPFGESSRLLDLFTERFGRVTALATGVRGFRSKLRLNLQDLTSVRLSLIRGRNQWRITQAETNAPLFPGLLRQEPKRALVARLLGLVERLVVTDGRRADLYRDLDYSFKFLAVAQLNDLAWSNYELLAVARILVNLGYCDGPDFPWPVAGNLVEQQRVVEEFTSERRRAVTTIKEALFHSHL